MKLLNGLGFAAFLFAGFSIIANAHPFTVKECSELASDAGHIATIRDHGVSLADIMPSVDYFINSDSSEYDSYILDPQDKLEFIALVEAIYSHPEIIPKHVSEKVYDACFKVAIRSYT